MGFRLALMMAKDWNFSRIIVEGDDALQVVQALNQEKTYANCDSIIHDCLKLASCFLICSFSHVKPQCNRVAHFVAKHALFRKANLRDNFSH